MKDSALIKYRLTGCIQMDETFNSICFLLKRNDDSVLGEVHGITLPVADCGDNCNEKHLLEGISISMDLVVVCTDSGDDSGDSNENANVDLERKKEQDVVRRVSSD